MSFRFIKLFGRRESFYGRQLKKFDSSKHSGVIAFFTKEYLKTEILNRDMALIIKDSSLCREKSDYDDFYVAGHAEAEEQLKNATYFVHKIEKYIDSVDEDTS